MSATNKLAELSELGVSVWMDDLSRQRLRGGTEHSLDDLIATDHVVGVTTNPSIFAASVARGNDYDADLTLASHWSHSVAETVTTITTTDVQAACDHFTEVAERTEGVDGRVSIEVDPFLAHDTQATLAQVEELAERVDRPNLHIKIPATIEGLPAITQAIANGHSINVTLIFSLDRYRAVTGAYLDGLERARAAGHDLSKIHSVASFFVSRIDTAVDEQLANIGGAEADRLHGQVALANARLAHEAYEEIFATERWRLLEAAGARPQRLLWASTSTKDPSFRPTRYVEELVTAGVVNTMPVATLRQVADQAEFSGDTVRGRYGEARQVLADLERLGVSYDDVMADLEAEGVQKFQDSWEELCDTVRLGMGYETKEMLS